MESAQFKVSLRSQGPYLILAALIFLVYFNALWNDFVWDDEILIVENHLLRSWRNLPVFFTQSFFQQESGGFLGGSYYRPLILVSFAVDSAIWGLRPSGYHVMNILLHCLNVCLFYHFFSRLFKDRRIGFLAGLLYSVNPVHTQAVTYIAGRTDLLATFFFLLGLLSHQRFRNTADGGRSRYLVGTLVAFSLSLLCKETTATLPLILVLYDICFTDTFKHSGFRWRTVAVYSAFAGILGGYFLARRLVIPEQSLGFMISSFSDLASRIATITVIIASYWKLLLFPLHLSTERNVELIRSLLSPVFLWSAAVFICILLLTVRWWFSDKKLFFCAMWFFIAFLPVSNIIPIFPARASSHFYCAEQLMYIPSMGFFVAAASIITGSIAPDAATPGARWRRRLLALSVLLLVMEFSGLTIRRTTDWRDSVTFYTRALASNPESVRLRNNLGVHYMKNRQHRKALELFESAAALQPDSISAYNNMAAIYEDFAQLDRAESLYRKALSYSEKDIRARIGLARILAQTGRVEEAKRELALLTEWYPTLSAAHHELGRILAAQGLYEQALDRFQRALPGSPSPDVVLNSIGIIYARQGKLEQAADYFTRALKANPGSYQAHVNLGNIYFEQNLPEKAAKEYEAALRSGIRLPAIEQRLRQLRSMPDRGNAR